MYPFVESLAETSESRASVAKDEAEILYLQCQSAAAEFGTVP